MNRGFSLRLMGVMLILAAPAIILGGAIYTYFQPRLYFSKAVMKAKQEYFVPSYWMAPRETPAPLDPTIISSLITQEANNPHTRLFGVRSFTVRQIRETDLYEIGVYDQDRLAAAEQANRIASFFVGQTSALQPPRFVGGKIWDKAEPALTPSRPKAFQNLVVAALVGLSGAAFGLLLLLISGLWKSRQAYA